MPKYQQPVLEPYNSGYYVLVGCYIEPVEADRPRINKHVHEQLVADVADGRSVPLVFRDGDGLVHFSPDPDTNVQRNTIEVPTELAAEMQLDEPPCRLALLVARPDHAKTLQSVTSEEREVIN